MIETNPALHDRHRIIHEWPIFRPTAVTAGLGATFDVRKIIKEHIAQSFFESLADAWKKGRKTQIPAQGTEIIPDVVEIPFKLTLKEFPEIVLHRFPGEHPVMNQSGIRFQRCAGPGKFVGGGIFNQLSQWLIIPVIDARNDVTHTLGDRLPEQIAGNILFKIQ